MIPERCSWIIFSAFRPGSAPPPNRSVRRAGRAGRRGTARAWETAPPPGMETSEDSRPRCRSLSPLSPGPHPDTAGCRRKRKSAGRTGGGSEKARRPSALGRPGSRRPLRLLRRACAALPGSGTRPERPSRARPARPPPFRPAQTNMQT